MDNRILGAFLSIVLLSMMVVPFREWIDAAHDARVAQVASQEATRIEQAGDGYIRSYATQVEAVASATHPATLTVPMLISTGFLPQGYTTVNPYGQTWEVQVAQPAAGQLQAVVTTNGGTPLKDRQAEAIVVDLGNSGGFYPDDNTGRYQSGKLYGNGWGPIPVGAYSIAKGSVVDWVNLSGADDTWNFLYRNAVPGNTAVNTMNTPLIMAAVETAGNACGTTGAIAQDGTGALLTCQSGSWQAVGGGHWKSPVATYRALPGNGNQVGDVRLTEDTNRAFAWTGSTWQALAVDQNGNLNVPNNGSFGGSGSFGGDLQVVGELGTNGYSPHAGLPPGWGGGIQTWDIDAHGTIGVGPNNLSPSAFMNSAGTIGNQGVCVDNNSRSCSGWGVYAHYTDGWGFVASDGLGDWNANARSYLGSGDVNDLYVRSAGEWFSQVASQVGNLTNDYSSQQNEISNLNSDYSSQQIEITDLQNELHGLYVGTFGPATETTTSTYSCGWRYFRWGRQWTCGNQTITTPASASGTTGNWLLADGSHQPVNCQGQCGPTLPNTRLLVIVTALVGSQNGGSQGANWDGLNTPCTGNGVGASLLITVDGQNVADLSLTKTGQPDYQTWVATENTTSFMVPAGGDFNIQANNSCVQFKGTLWEF
jgi:hypothetical protein